MSKYSVVIVDDDVMMLKQIRMILSEKDIKVIVLRSGKELLVYMENKRPDLILLDIIMPDMDGFEVYHKLRDYERDAGLMQTPVIFISGNNDSETERKGLKEGAADFIYKPFNKDILIQRITNTIRNSRAIENLTEEAYTDNLTGLINKANSDRKLSELCLVNTGAMLIIDLDNFKLVNDIYGHDMGDKVLRVFADIARDNTCSEDVLCRIGGDEFAAFCTNLENEESISSFTVRINEQLIRRSKELMGDDFDIPLGVSVGAVFVPEHGRDYQTLFHYADKALYYVKINGKHGYAIHNPEVYYDKADSEDPEKELAHISRVIEERNTSDTTMWLGQDALKWIYRFIYRMPDNYAANVMKLVLMLSQSKNGNIEEYGKAIEQFKGILQSILGRSDIVMQGKSNLFFVMLTDAGDNPENYAEDIVNSILEEIRCNKNFDCIDISYAMERLRNI